MKTFYIDTLGCKVNQYESQQIRELLEQLGLNEAQTADKANLIIVNTCCVTHTASAKSRQYIRKAQRQNPDAVVVVCGCLPTVQLGELNGLNIRRTPAGESTCVIRDRRTIAEALSRIVTPSNEMPGSKKSNLNFENDIVCKSELPSLTSFKGHTRAFLKVQDGCDGYCSYCIVPKTRPVIYSKPIEQVLREAQALVEAGHKEIVVTGVFLGAYGQKTVRRKNRPDLRNDKLAELLDKMAQIPNLARIRLSSLEPADVTPGLIDTFCKNRNIMPHLHLSLQSGSDSILKKMCRQYTAEEFREKVDLVKSRLDRPAITTDIIVGFPGETDSDFIQTVNLAKDIGFAKIHIFSYSPRKGTAAASMPGKLDNKIIKKRAQILRDLGTELGINYRQQFIGETTSILVENCNGQVYGRSERYFVVYLEQPEDIAKQNELVNVKMIKNRTDGLIGQI